MIDFKLVVVCSICIIYTCMCVVYSELPGTYNQSIDKQLMCKWHLLITLIVSCTDTTVASGNLNIISLVARCGSRSIIVILNYERL